MELSEELEGYDSDLFEEPEKAAEFRCPICTMISHNPVETEPCGHLFCKTCLDTYFNANTLNECPKCRNKVESTSQSKWVKRQINTLRVKCKNNGNNNCTWKGSLCDLPSHLNNNCLFAQINCKYCNLVQYYRKDEQEHSSVCESWPINCSLCNSIIIRNQLKEHENNSCPLTQINCPEGCNNIFTRVSLNNHLSLCPQKKIDCLYNNYGCIHKPLRNDYQKHLNLFHFEHLEMKMNYLQKLSVSKELILVSNVTGSYPAINGIYQRQSIPYNGYPMYKHQNKENIYMYYHNELSSWVIDKNKTAGDIAALRYGMYSHPSATDSEIAVINSDNNNDNKINIEQKENNNNNNNNNNNIDNTEIKNEEKSNASVSAQSLIDQKKLKHGIFIDGNWHVKGPVENSILRVEGYTQKELDLEWELKMITSKLKQIVNNSVLSTNKSSPIICKCSRELEYTTIDKLPFKPVEILCNSCERKIEKELYHCSSTYSMAHLQGYDLCVQCGEAKRQTQHMGDVICDCGSRMVPLQAQLCYELSSMVVCNRCASIVSDIGVAFHCQKKRSKYHPNGYDLCVPCATNINKSRRGISSWFGS